FAGGSWIGGQQQPQARRITGEPHGRGRGPIRLAGADDDRVLAEQLRPFAVRAVEEVALAGVGEAGGEVAVHRRVIAGNTGGEKESAPSPRLSFAASEEEVLLLPGGRHHAGVLELRPQSERLGLELL